MIFRNRLERCGPEETKLITWSNQFNVPVLKTSVPAIGDSRTEQGADLGNQIISIALVVIR
jgi:hypothetical protein